MQSGNPYPVQPPTNVSYANSAPVHAYPASSSSMQPNSAVPMNPMNPGQVQHKRPLNSTEDSNDPHWKRVRFEGSGAQPSGVQGQYTSAAPATQHHAVRPMAQQASVQQPVAYQSTYYPAPQYAGVQHAAPQQPATQQSGVQYSAAQQPTYQPIAQHLTPHQPVAQRPAVQQPAAQYPVQQHQQPAALQPAPPRPFAAHQSAVQVQQPAAPQIGTSAANLLQSRNSSNDRPATASATAAAPPAQQARPEDFPVVEALVRREGTDKLKRVPVDGTLNAAERAEVGLDEKKKICPKSAVDQVIAGLGADEDFAVDDDVKAALGLLAENMLEHTMEFGALMASRRNSKWLQAKDLECYLERAWHISLPGFSSRCVTAAPKTAVESTDMKNKASVRSYLAQLPVQQPSDGAKKDAGEGGAGGS